MLNIATLGGVVYAMFEREVDGNTKKYLERFDDVEMDSTVRYDGAATTTITGLSSLEGKTVDIVADGKIHEQKTVSSGEVELDFEASKVDVGLPYESKIKLLPPVRELPNGTMAGQIRRVVALVLGLTDSFGVEVDGNNIPFLRFGSFSFGQSPPLFSGRKRVTLLGYDREPAIEIIQKDPIDFHLTDVVLEVSV